MPLNGARNTLGDIARLLAPRPGRFELSTRLALISALTVLVAEIYQTPEPPYRHTSYSSSTAKTG
jgi:multidrug resistance protein MdtO